MCGSRLPLKLCGKWVMKKRLRDEGNETVTNCNALKLKAKDGKYRMTDVVDIEGMFRLLSLFLVKMLNL